MRTPGRAGAREPVRVDGLREAREALQSIPEAVREVFAERFQEMGKAIEAGAIEKAPRGPTGDLKASIGMNTREDGLQVAIGSGEHYAPFVELGTSRSKKKPFLYPTFQRTVRDFRRAVKADGEKLRSKVRKRNRWKK